MTNEVTYQLAVHVTPRSGCNQVAGVRESEPGQREVLVRVTAAPEGGKANKAVCQVVAKSLGIAKGRIQVQRGDSSRHKMLSVQTDPTTVESWLAGLPMRQ